jgi:hypothetical protein
MTLNRELFVEDPTQYQIPNLGVAKVVEPTTPEELEVLRYELSHFVCEGQYERGLHEILGAFLRNLDQPAQPAAWVSGFFGSGKSHLVRVLRYLWTDFEFPDGGTAHGLVHVPTTIRDQLNELRTVGKREGGLWAASGTLGAGAGDSVRLAFLGIVLRAAGLPERVEPAQFVLWLNSNGILEKVRTRIEKVGREWSSELRALYVSPVIAEALIAASPGFANSPADARALLKAQFPPVTDVSDEEFIRVLTGVLAMQSKKTGRFPATLVVIDELQQFINDDLQRMAEVQNVVEACSMRFESRLVIVATGQSALQATPILQKLQDRFLIRVPLSDTDVESVIRRVVLMKRPDRTDELKKTLDEVSGEIDRQLTGSKIGRQGEDADDLVPLYPILPTRQRFWERVSRAIDPGGHAGVLRTQLRMAHEAAQAVGNENVGTVVGGDFIYGQQATGMLETGGMLRETYNTIEGLRNGTADGDLRMRVAALAFLISKLPSEAGADIGVRATPQMVADLLVEDLKQSSGDLRKRVAKALETMAGEGILDKVGDEYRLLTKESANWQAEYQQRLALLKNDSGRIGSDRDLALKTAAQELLRKISLTQGKSKVARKVLVHFGQTAPPDDKSSIPIWVRDGWECTLKTVRDEAVTAGIESPTVFVWLPRQDDDALRAALTERAASQDTITSRPVPVTAEGQDARAGMESRRLSAETRTRDLVTQILRNAKVFQGGGNEVSAATLEESVRSAAEGALDRRFPQFSIADYPDWSKVILRAREGSAEPLMPVGDSGEVADNPACKEVLMFVPGSWTKGSDIRRHFLEADYGWPQDAVDAALVALVGATALSARQNGQDVSVKALSQGSLSKTDFRKEITVVSAQMRIAVRGLMADVGMKVDSGEEAVALHTYLERVLQLAEGAGGEPPLPARPDVTQVKQLQLLSGNQLIGAVHARVSELKALQKDWKKRADLATERLPRWSRLIELLERGSKVHSIGTVQQQVSALRTGRKLLDEPDPLGPLVSSACDLLRKALLAAHATFSSAIQRAMAVLSADENWSKLDQPAQQVILDEVGLVTIVSPQVGTESALLDSLRATSLSEWEDRAAASDARAGRARELAAKHLLPKSTRYVPQPATLQTSEAVEKYVEDLREDLLGRIKDGPVVI